MELRFDIQSDAWVPRDMSVLYPEITRSGIIDMEYQKEPDDIIWCVLANGKLIGMTYDREQNIYAWHQHELAGVDAKVEAVQVIGSPAGDVDDVWVVVSRTVQGDLSYEMATEAGDNLITEGDNQIVTQDDIDLTRRSIEYFAQGYEEGEDIQGAVYLDSALEFNPTSTVSLFLGNGYNVVGSTSVAFTVTTPDELATELGDSLVTEASEIIVLNDETFASDDAGRDIIYRYYDSATEQWRSARATITNQIDQDNVLVKIIAAFPINDIPAGQWRLTSTKLRGMYHLEGETVTALADGAQITDLVVEDGTVTLPIPASRAIVGLPYTSTLATQRIEAGAAVGTAQAKIKRIHKLGVRLYASLGGKIGPSATNLDLIPYRIGSDLLDEVPPVLTGDTDVLGFPGGYETDGRIWVVADQPLPLTVVALYPELETAG